jgi:hypothetical protein
MANLFGTTLYRIEDAEGWGIWAGMGAKALGWDGGATRSRPSPTYDPAFQRRGRWDHTRFAFTSISQMKSWVRRKWEREKLDEIGYRLCTYEIPDEEDCIIGEKQAAFNPDAAIKTGCVKISEV